MGLFDTIFGTALDVYGGVYGAALDEGKNLLEGRDSASDVLQDTGGALANSETTKIVNADTGALKSTEGDVATGAGAAAIEQDKRVQTGVNAAGALYGGVASLAPSAAGGAASTVAASSAAKSGAEAAPSASTDVIAPATTGVSAEGQNAGQEAPDVISGADQAAPTALPPPPESVLNETQGTNQLFEKSLNETTGTADKIGKSQASKIASAAGKGLKAGNEGAHSALAVKDQIDKKSADVDASALPSAATSKADTPGAKTEIPQIGGDMFGTIFGNGTPKSLYNAPDLNPLSNIGASVAPPQVIRPAPLVPTPQFQAAPFQSANTYQSVGNPQNTTTNPALSDQTKKTKIKSADRSIQDFLNQLNRRT